MTAPTAGAIVAALERRRLQSDLASLAELDGELVKWALCTVPPHARIDVPCLVATLRQEARARAEAAAQQPSSNALHILRERLALAALGELPAPRDEPPPFAPNSPGASILAKLDRIAERMADDRAYLDRLTTPSNSIVWRP